MTEAAARSEPLDVSAGEKKDLIGLVEEAQSKRMTRKLRPSEVPKILLPYQVRQHRNASALRLTDKCRRIGWSWGCIAAEGALEAARERGMSQFYMGYNLGMAAENIGDALTFARAYGLASGALSDVEVFRDRETMQVWEGGVLGEKRQDITRFKLTFASGWVYEALSSAPWNWRGRQGHAWIDEAAFHVALREVLKGAMAFLMWGGRVDVISTENGEDNEFHEMVRDFQAGKLPKWSFTKVDFDQALREGFYKRVCLILGKEWSPKAEAAYRAEIFEGYPSIEDANEELLCIPKRGSGVYFSRLLLENRMLDGIPVIRWEKPAEWVTAPDRLAECEQWIKDTLQPALDGMTPHRSTYGQDFARDADVSDIVVCQERAPNVWTEAFSVELRSIPYDVQARIRDAILEGVPALHHASFDASGNGGSHAEGALQRFGAARVSCIKISAAFYAEWFPKYRQSYEDGSTWIARSEDTIVDHRMVVSTKNGPAMDAKRAKGADGKPRHGDRAVAGLMEYHARCQDGGPMEVATGGIPRQSLGGYALAGARSGDDVEDHRDYGGWDL